MKRTGRTRATGWGGSARGANPPRATAGWLARHPTSDVNVQETISLVSPREVCRDLPVTPKAHLTVVESRQSVKEILSGSDRRLLVIVGPCSVHDENAAMDYATRLAGLRRELKRRLCIVMR
ncbi:MAG: hypothetical protein ACPMAQ_15780, partial [Phycisphaerae bacterium]